MAQQNSINNAQRPIITKFTANGTWTKDPDTVWVRVILWGGGQGGASGPRTAAGISSFGGTGGVPGGVYIGEALADQLGATETVTIGAGGFGATVPGDDSASVPGGFGGATRFGNFNALGGDTSGGSNNFLTSDISFNATRVSGGTGGNGVQLPSYSGTLFGVPFGGNYSRFQGTAGGGGGGITTAEVAQAGGRGNPFCLWNRAFDTVLLDGGAGGAINGNGDPGEPYTNLTTGGFSASTGGGGGGSGVTGAAGNGGDGAIAGAGGGGGGASRNGMTGGAGGNGGRGEVWAIEF